MNNLTTIITALISLSTTVIMGILLIPLLKRLKFGQSIREDGPKWHMQKSGTPTMGGIMFIVGISFSVLISYFMIMSSNKGEFQFSKDEMMLFAGLIMAILFGAVGFLDDYIKVVKKQNLGLKARQKLMLQILITTLYLVAIYFLRDGSTLLNIPFFGYVDMSYFYYPIMGVFIIGIVNSVNLTDGIDGLCTSVTFIVALFFMAASVVLDILMINILATALAAGCIGFLFFNAYPAKVFMGDTGSMFLGGMVIALGFGINAEILIILVGFIYCIESLSVIMQVISYKTRKKRIFRMSPIHHHFEMGGMSENKIVFMFCTITLLTSIVSFIAVLATK